MSASGWFDYSRRWLRWVELLLQTDELQLASVACFTHVMASYTFGTLHSSPSSQLAARWTNHIYSLKSFQDPALVTTESAQS